MSFVLLVPVLSVMIKESGVGPAVQHIGLEQPWSHAAARITIAADKKSFMVIYG
jgi:hypothetical protein